MTDTTIHTDVPRCPVVAGTDFTDPTDLASAWMLLPVEHHATFRAAAGGIDGATWRRAAAWAIAFGIAILTGTGPSEHLRPVAHRAIAAVLAEAWPHRIHEMA